jgi:predicted Rossmann fold nucleotide-binding protein DprA/Smf involved in DNA uptake
MDIIYLEQDDPRYPPGLQTCLGKNAPNRLTALGSLEVLGGRKLALFGSVKCPASLILKAHDVAHALREGNMTVMSGFHSPVEQEVLTVLLQGRARVVVGVARGLTGMRVKREFRGSLEQGRLLFVSPCSKERRASADTALYRNRLLAALGDEVLVIHASLGGRSEMFCRELVAWGRPVYALAHPANEHLRDVGVVLKSAADMMTDGRT